MQLVISARTRVAPEARGPCHRVARARIIRPSPRLCRGDGELWESSGSRFAAFPALCSGQGRRTGRNRKARVVLVLREARTKSSMSSRDKQGQSDAQRR